jgi:hypothetical protein
MQRKFVQRGAKTQVHQRLQPPEYSDRPCAKTDIAQLQAVKRRKP